MPTQVRFEVVSAAVAVSLSLCACGGGGEASTGDAATNATDGGFVLFDGALPADAPPIAIGDLCPLFTQDLCMFLMQCSNAAYKDMDQCLAENTCYGYAQLKQAAAEGAVLYDPEKVGACNEVFRGNPCGFGAQFLFTPDIFEVLGVCSGALTPQLDQGQSCSSSGECKSVLFCKKQGNLCPGTCTAYATTGQPCAQNGFVPDAGSGQCANDLVCNSKEKCQPFGSVGSPCAMDSDCGPVIICLDDPSCQNLNLWCDVSKGTCATGVSVGSPCGAGPAGNTQCAPDLWCQPFVDAGTEFVSATMPGTCVAPGGAGAPCDIFGGCQQGLHCVKPTPFTALGQCAGPSGVGTPCTFGTDCATGLACLESDGGMACAPPSGLGGPCTGQDGQCATGLVCSSTKCLTARYPGDPCDDTTSTCVLSACKAGTCVNYANVGAPCAVNADCATNACIGGTCADTSVCSNPGDAG